MCALPLPFPSRIPIPFGNACRWRFLAISAIAVAGLRAQCRDLRAGPSLTVLVASNRPACVSVRIPAGEALRIAVKQPIDLILAVKVGDDEVLADGFDFGRETLTLTTSGTYRIEVRAVEESERSPRFVAVVAEPLPAAEAERWREAERFATESKREPTEAGIAASLEKWRSLGDTASIARTLLQAGDEKLDRAEAVPALASYEEAGRLCRAAEDFRCAAEAEHNSGIAAQQVGDFDLAEQRLQTAAEHWRRIGDRVLEGVTRSNLGRMRWQTGDYQQAVALQREAGAVLRQRDPVAYARVLNSLGLCYQSMAEYPKAEIHFLSALTTFEARHLPRDAVRARLNLGRTYLLEGRTAIADATLRSALKQARDQRDRRATADVLSNLSQVMLERRLYEEARAASDEALTIDRALHDLRGEAFDLHYLGVAHQRLGVAEKARELLLEALRLRESAGLREDASETLFVLASLERDTGNRDAARLDVERAMKLVESVRSRVPGPALRASYYSRKRRFFDLLVDLADDGPQAASETLLASERGRSRALLDLLAEGAISRQTPAGLLERRLAIQRRIDLLAAAFSNALPERRPELRVQIEAAVSEDEEVEAAVRAPLGEQKFGRRLESIAELQTAMPSDAALLEFHLGERRSYVWLVRRDSIRMFPLPPKARIEERAARAADRVGQILLRKRSTGLQRGMEADLKWLSRLLFGPLSGETLPARVLIAPDGVLGRVPFAALQYPAEAQPLGLTHDLVQIPAAAFLLATAPPRPVAAFPRAVLAVADPVFSLNDSRVDAPAKLPAKSEPAGLARLSFAAELETLGSLLPPGKRSVLRGFDANRRSVSALPLSDFAVLHFATHALIDDRTPELSRVALSMVDRTGHPEDGFLRPYHFDSFRLNGSVVVLSACSTALGKQVLGEGMAGFTSSLFHAGAAQLVLTLAEVDAEATSEFFSAVYRQYLGPRPMPLEHALTIARSTMARSARWSDPYYWASIIIVGRPAERR